MYTNESQFNDSQFNSFPLVITEGSTITNLDIYTLDSWLQSFSSSGSETLEMYLQDNGVENFNRSTENYLEIYSDSNGVISFNEGTTSIVEVVPYGNGNIDFYDSGEVTLEIFARGIPSVGSSETIVNITSTGFGSRNVMRGEKVLLGVELLEEWNINAISQANLAIIDVMSDSERPDGSHIEDILKED